MFSDSVSVDLRLETLPGGGSMFLGCIMFVFCNAKGCEYILMSRDGLSSVFVKNKLINKFPGAENLLVNNPNDAVVNWKA